MSETLMPSAAASTPRSCRLAGELEAQIQRVRARVEHHEKALQRNTAELWELESVARKMREAVELRRQAIQQRWRVRKALREIRAAIECLGPFTAPSRAGGVRTLSRSRAGELANTLWRRAAPIHRSLGQSGVYVLFHGNDMVYVGQAVNVLLRIGQHLREKAFTHAAYISAPVEQLNSLERALLDVYAPRLNRDTRTQALRRRVTSGQAASMSCATFADPPCAP
jgi:hypothetical protein